jgi:hypothetical protein
MGITHAVTERAGALRWGGIMAKRKKGKKGGKKK